MFKVILKYLCFWGHNDDFTRVQTVDHCYRESKPKKYIQFNTILSYNLGLHIHCNILVCMLFVIFQAE